MYLIDSIYEQLRFNHINTIYHTGAFPKFLNNSNVQIVLQ